MELLKELLKNYWPRKVYEGRFVISTDAASLRSLPITYIDDSLEKELLESPSKAIIENLEIKITPESLNILKFLMGKNIPGKVNYLITMRMVNQEVKAVKDAILELMPVPDLEYYDILFPIFIITDPLPGLFAILAISRDKKVSLLAGTPNKFIEKTYHNVNLVSLHQTVKLITDGRIGSTVAHAGALPILGILNFLLNQTPVSVTHDIGKVLKTLTTKPVSAFSIMIKIHNLESVLDNLISPALAKKVLEGEFVTWKEKEKIKEALEVLAVFNLDQVSTFNEKYNSTILYNYAEQLGLKLSPTKSDKFYWIQFKSEHKYYEVKNIDLLKEIEKIKQMIISYESGNN